MKNSAVQKIITAISLLTLSACSYNASVKPISAAASEIRLDRHKAGAVAVVFNDEIQHFNREVWPTNTGLILCNERKLQFEIGTALRQSIYDLMDGAYSSVNLASRADDTDNAFHTYVFNLSSFDARLSVNVGVWAASVSAHVEVVLQVSVQDEAGNLLMLTTISAAGKFGPKTGRCSMGAQALADASRDARDAIEDSLETLVYEVINSDRI